MAGTGRRRHGPGGDLLEEHVEKVQRRSHSDAGAPGEGVEGLRVRGFARYGAAQLGISAGSALRDLARIREVCAALPPDPYAPGTNRFRRYSHAVYLPWKDELSWIPGTPHPVHGTVTDFSQGEDDPEHPQKRRVLPDIPEALRGNALLLRLLRWDIEQVLFLKNLGNRPLWAGVHLIRLGVDRPGQDAVSSPNCLHQDGGSASTFTFAHLISRTNVTGGQNVIATPGSAGLQPEDPWTDIHAAFTLTDPLDGYARPHHTLTHNRGPGPPGAPPGPRRTGQPK
ncbi:2OG-Fe dioxygenase family protein, partial [Streptomyces sp. NPDC058682]|uniref:2OG-Fe dioxygenase family protein n=1 Tax=Streptomyces sp. NPDC058682 TaxID=3346596 RepID=UPI00365B072F